jgi:hypothetical protein
MKRQPIIQTTFFSLSAHDLVQSEAEYSQDCHGSVRGQGLVLAFEASYSQQSRHGNFSGYKVAQAKKCERSRDQNDDQTPKADWLHYAGPSQLNQV